jgi:hypothetical protein
MAKDTDVDAVLEGLDHLQAVQEQHGEVLHHLERRPVVDLQGLVRRLEEVADAVERLTPPPPAITQTRWVWLPTLLLIGLLVGWFSCWLTVRWLPGSLLPPGFSRVTPPPPKGRF